MKLLALLSVVLSAPAPMPRAETHAAYDYAVFARDAGASP